MMFIFQEHCCDFYGWCELSQGSYRIIILGEIERESWRICIISVYSILHKKTNYTSYEHFTSSLRFRTLSSKQSVGQLWKCSHCRLALCALGLFHKMATTPPLREKRGEVKVKCGEIAYNTAERWRLHGDSTVYYWLPVACSHFRHECKSGTGPCNIADRPVMSWCRKSIPSGPDLINLPSGHISAKICTDASGR